MQSIPNHVSAYVALIAVSFSVGLWAGSSRQQHQRHRPENKNSLATGAESDSDSESDNEGNDVSGLLVEPDDECKLALVVRTDLGMTPGKIAAQCSHATLACYKTMLNSNPNVVRQWERSGQTKVALRCADETELLTLQAQALSLRLCARSIRDAGRTQIAAGSMTVLGILGPARLVNQITGALRLL